MDLACEPRYVIRRAATGLSGSRSGRTDITNGFSMITRSVSELVPHGGLMCLLERVIEWDETCVVAATTSHRSSQNPLLLNGRLHAVNLCEYGGQAMALHGGLLADREGRRAPPGFLVSLRDVTLAPSDVHDLPDELIVRAQCLMADSTGWQYSFSVRHRNDLLAEGRAAISLQRF